MQGHRNTTSRQAASTLQRTACGYVKRTDLSSMAWLSTVTSAPLLFAPCFPDAGLLNFNSASLPWYWRKPRPTNDGDHPSGPGPFSRKRRSHRCTKPSSGSWKGRCIQHVECHHRLARSKRPQMMFEASSARVLTARPVLRRQPLLRKTQRASRFWPPCAIADDASPVHSNLGDGGIHPASDQSNITRAACTSKGGAMAAPGHAQWRYALWRGLITHPSTLVHNKHHHAELSGTKVNAVIKTRAGVAQLRWLGSRDQMFGVVAGPPISLNLLRMEVSEILF